jgi:RNA polymerase sigma factor (sigma-70 family)
MAPKPKPPSPPGTPSPGDQPPAPRAGVDCPSLLLADAVPWLRDQVRSCCHRHHLQGSDAEEALECILVAASEQLKEYHPSEVRGPVELSFRAWLRPLVRRRLADFLRKRSSLLSHYDRSANMDQIQASEATGQRVGRPRVGAEKDPVVLAEQHEQEERVTAAKRCLSATDRQRFDLCWSGLPVNEIARQLGVTPKQARLLKDKLLDKVKAAMRRPPR